MNHFSIGLWHAMKSGFYMTSSDTISLVVGPRRSSKAFSKAKLAPKNAHGHWLVVCCQSDPLQLFESWWNHYIWEADRWDGPKTATPAANTGQQKGLNSSQQCPTTHHTTNTSKIEQDWQQDGGGVGGHGVHLSPWIHQEYTFIHRSACRPPAENGQEYLTSGKKYIEPRKTW